MANERERDSRDFLEMSVKLAGWTIASLLVVNGGALASLIQSNHALKLVPAAGFFFFLGLVFTLLAAIIAVVGFFFAGVIRQVYDTLPSEKLGGPEGKRYGRWLDAAFVAIVFGLLLWVASLGMFIWGAVAARSAIATIHDPAVQISSPAQPVAGPAGDQPPAQSQRNR